MSDRIKHWLADTAERVASTAAQALLGVLPADGLPHTHIPWGTKLSIVGFAALACFLKCVVALRVGADDSASLLPADQDPPVADDGEGGWGAVEVLAVVGVVLVVMLAVGYLHH
jgi:hypothetical protein